MMLNCPNCGGVTEGFFCSYCGTPLYSPLDALVELEKGYPCHIWWEDKNGCIMCLDIVLNSLDMLTNYEPIYSLDGDALVSCVLDRTLTMSGTLREPDGDQWMKYVEQIRRNRDENY